MQYWRARKAVAERERERERVKNNFLVIVHLSHIHYGNISNQKPAEKKNASVGLKWFGQGADVKSTFATCYIQHLFFAPLTSQTHSIILKHAIMCSSFSKKGLVDAIAVIIVVAVITIGGVVVYFVCASLYAYILCILTVSYGVPFSSPQ